MPPVKYHIGKFPPQNIDWRKIVPLIGPANAAIAKYEGVLKIVPNSDVLLSPLTMQEAVLSSKIEGTQATLGEVLEYEAEKKVEENTPQQADIREVLNYRSAIKEGRNLLGTLPLSLRLVRKLHEVLMQGVRGRNKSPGEFRKIPNWIGAPGCEIDEARFVSCPVEHLSEALSKWEYFLHEDFDDKLVQLAVAHAEFEAIHPFLDGNGRLGRLLIPLFLYEKKVLEHPNFYISEYLESHRDEYYDALLNVSKNGDWTQWIVFFLNALIEQAESNQAKALKILNLYNEKKEWIVQKTHSQYAIQALDWIFATPIFRSSDFVLNAGIPEASAKRIVRELKDTMLKELKPARGRQAAILAFYELLNIAEGHNAF
jgi:Fic family protein